MQGRVGRNICGMRFKNSNGLKDHLKDVHGMPMKNRETTALSFYKNTLLRPALSECLSTRLGLLFLTTFTEFFVDIMKDEEYPGKGGTMELSIDTMSLDKQVLAKPHGDDDDEAVPHKNKIQNCRKRKASPLPESRLESDFNSDRVREPSNNTQQRTCGGSADPSAVQGTTSHNQVEKTREEVPVPEAECSKREKPTSNLSNVIDLSDESGDDEELQAELQSIYVQKEIKQLELQELQLKQKLTARKKSRAPGGTSDGVSPRFDERPCQ